MVMEFFSHIPAGGTIFNAGAILIGGALGLVIGRFISAKMQNSIFQCFGLFCIYIGIDMALKTQNMLTVLVSLVLGAIVGELCNFDLKLVLLGDHLKTTLKIGDKTFTEGFVTTTLLYCVGSMAILGAIENGARGNPSLLITKGVMDGTSSILFAASMGVGVLFSALPILIYQGAFTFAATWAEGFITPTMLNNLTGLGGLMVLAIGMNLLKIAEFKTSNLLPGLVFVLLLSAML